MHSSPHVWIHNILISDVHFLPLSLSLSLSLCLSLLHNVQELIKDSTDEQRKYIHLQRLTVRTISLCCNVAVSHRSQIQSELPKIFMN